jgi:hypothetical protein
MNCLWEDVPNTTDERGRRRVQCKRCRRKLNPTAAPHVRIFANCKALPYLWEFGHWLSIHLGAWGITERGAHLVARLIGLSGCGCKKRRAALNTLGSRFNQALAWLTGYNTP